MIYVAAPYSHEEHSVRSTRVDEVAKFITHLYQQDKRVCGVSPILLHREEKNPGTWIDWAHYCCKVMDHCGHMYVLMLDGWEESTGIRGEENFAKLTDMLIFYYNPDFTLAENSNEILARRMEEINAIQKSRRNSSSNVNN